MSCGHNELQRKMERLFQAACAQRKFTSPVTEGRGGGQLHEGRGRIYLVPVPGIVPGPLDA